MDEEIDNFCYWKLNFRSLVKFILYFKVLPFFYLILFQGKYLN